MAYFKLTNLHTASRPFSISFFHLLIFFISVQCHVSIVTAASNGTTNIGAILDFDSIAGKEQKTAMVMAVKKFNTNSKDHKLAIHFQNSNGDPLDSASSAEELIKEKNVQVIIGMNKWEEAALVANIGQRAQVPVISFSTPAITPTVLQWPFLVQMATSVLEEINCIVAIVHSYNWQRVIVVYEGNAYGGENEALALLSEGLQKVGSEIEHRLVLPPILLSSSDLTEIVREEIAKVLENVQSRVFIVLRSSLPMANRLFNEAKQMGLVGRDSVWILGESVSSLLDSVDTPVLSNIQGALGIKTYYSEASSRFLEFKSGFREMVRLDYLEEDKLVPGIHSLRAYDSIEVVSRAEENLGSESSNNSKILLNGNIQSSNFFGLSGNIHFHGGKLSGSPIFKIINIVGKSNKEIGFWSPKFGFSNHPGKMKGVHSMRVLSAKVNWPGDLNRDPKGWAMPTNAKPLKIGVPGRTSWERFVKVDPIEGPSMYTGFCIDVFKAALASLESKHGYSLPYKFQKHEGEYDDLVDKVYTKVYDVAVGDITILAHRSKYVQFTQPFTEPGLTMVVPVKSEPPWNFTKPFTGEMWLASFGILFYTMFVIWFMEHQSNQEFRGPWKDQLGTALWFTFSSLFFAQREKIQSNFSKVVVMTWLFVVFILNSSYTASLTSMLTVRKLEPNVTDIGWLRRTNATVGSDPDSFVLEYLSGVLELQNIKNISREDQYPDEFASGNITATFLETPYLKVFLNEYCNQYTAAGPTYRFGGQGFVFQKGSPIAQDFSEAILALSENGTLQKLETEWLNTSLTCSNTNSGVEGESLSLESFWGIFVISGLTSTICFLLFLARLLKGHLHQLEPHQSRWIKATRLVLVALRLHSQEMGSSSINEPNPSRWELVSPTEIPVHLEIGHDIGRPSEIEIPTRKLDRIGEYGR